MSTTAGNGFTVTVTAKDNYNNVVKLYNGTVSLSDAGDPHASFGPASTLASGVGTFSTRRWSPQATRALRPPTQMGTAA